MKLIFLSKCVVITAALYIVQAIRADEAEKDTANASAGIVVSKADEHGIVTKARPILPKLTTGDPLRFALHFETKDGPVDHGDPKLGPQLLDRTATLDTFEVAIRTPGENWQVLRGDIGDASPRKTMLYNNGTFLLEVREEGLASLMINGQQELLLPWKWKHPMTEGEYQIAVRGTLKLGTMERTIRERGKAPKKIPATKMEVAFQSKPVKLHVSREDMTDQSVAELSKQAIEALKKHATVAAEKLTVGTVDGLPIADAKGNRVIRVKTTIPPPPKPPGGIVIAIAGGTGYWQYEITMTPDGKVVSFARARKGFCVARGTKIATPEGDIPVEELIEGQQVWAYHVQDQTNVPATIRTIITNKAHTCVRINGDLRVTAAHPVLVKRLDTLEWTPAGSLREGDKLLSRDGTLSDLTSVEIEDGKFDVFDLAVDRPHNFFAGGILVHNKSIAWTPQAFVPWYALFNRAPALK